MVWLVELPFVYHQKSHPFSPMWSWVVYAGNEVGTSSGSLEVPGGGVSAGCAQGSSTQSG